MKSYGPRSAAARSGSLVQAHLFGIGLAFGAADYSGRDLIAAIFIYLFPLIVGQRKQGGQQHMIVASKQTEVFHHPIIIFELTNQVIQHPFQHGPGALPQVDAVVENERALMMPGGQPLKMMQ